MIVMENASPFGRNASHSIPQNVKREDIDRQENTKRFAQLKPICVELLGQVSSANDASRHETLYKTLKKLNDLLNTFKDSKVDVLKYSTLSPALTSYVFYPIAQLLRSITNPPDRIRIVQFSILASLADDWWQSWIDEKEESAKQSWQIWEQLLILAVTALDTKGKSGTKVSQSEECTASILALLHSLLAPRISQKSKQDSIDFNKPSYDDAWEWDGESELPDMDDYEAEMERLAEKARQKEGDVHGPELELFYPTDLHISHAFASQTCQGILAHALSTSLEQANIKTASRQIRLGCLQVVRIILQVWTAGSNTITDLAREVNVSKFDTSISARSTQHFSPEAQADRLVISLPATVSSTVRICNDPKCPSEVLAESIHLLKFVIMVTLNDAILPKTVKNVSKVSEEELDESIVSLDQLIANTHIDNEGESLKEEEESAASNAEKISNATETQQQPTKLRSIAWLRDTTSRIAFALQSFEKDLIRNANSSVSLALIDLAHTLLDDCYETLSEYNDQDFTQLPRLLFGWLMNKSSNKDISKRISDAAIDALVSLLGKRKTQSDTVIITELSNAAEQLPRLLSNPLGQDETITHLSDRIRFLAALASGACREEFSVFDGLSTLFSSKEYERWLLNIASSLTMDDTTLSDVGSVRLSGLEASTSKSFLKSVQEFGAAAARTVLHSQNSVTSVNGPINFVDYLLRLSIRWRSSNGKESRLSVNVILLAREAILGISAILEEGKLARLQGSKGVKTRKIAKRFARTIISLICEIWQADEEELLSGVPLANEQSLTEEERRLISTQKSDSDTLTEYTKGALKRSTEKKENKDSDLQLGPAVNVDFVSAASIVDKSNNGRSTIAPISKQQRRKKAIRFARMRDVLLLEILSEAAKILGSSLKSTLVHTLYPTICAVASSDPSTQEAASNAIQKISHAAGYASIEGCLLDHADYILGAASHRLISTLGEELHFRSQYAANQAIKQSTSSKFDSSLLALTLRNGKEEEVYTPLMSAFSAPLVLVELIRSLGTEVVVLVEDAIDEVLDAIDRFHADPNICDGLLSVLDRMLEVMLNKVTEESLLQLPIPDRGYQPNKEKDLEDFKKWFHQRGQTRKDDAETLFNNLESSGEPESGEKEDLSDPTQEETPAGRSQKVTVSMMKKAIPFLSHSSRTIRMRCLRLINRGVEILCRQGLTAEPLSVVNSCWPIVMSRIGFNLSRNLKSEKYLHKLPRLDEMDEKDFFVAVEAVKLLATLAKYLQTYLGSEKLLRQAMPRILLLLRIIQESEQRPGATPSTSEKQTTFLLKDEISTTTSKAVSVLHFQPFREYSPLATLIDTVLVMLNDLVYAMGASITEADLFSFASHSTFLAALDTRQPKQIQDHARLFYFDTLKNRNAALIWFVMESTLRSSTSIDHTSKAYPTFLYQPNLRLNLS